ncbi:MAG: alpha-L-fucosidase [Terracidiphilus sp.]|nr:alpha-L-fucosidase [Terracidiphilus sp.]MDR3796803.1 alpha-L-fucosidase [Terracidiphilus sp.]
MNRKVPNRRTQFAFAATLLVALACPARAQQTSANVQRQLARVDAAARTGPFRANWDSLAGYRVPEWFRDAKFGIFIHWGVYSVPAFGNEWYPRNMYIQGNAAFKHHVATYGPQSKFGYKDFIPMFRAEHFDANAWLDLFAQAGARYVVPVAEHCDGFAMYDSSLTDWDAAKMGPKRDVVGELEVATRRHGLHFGVSSHRAEHWWWYDGGMKFDSDVRDPRYAGLYGPAQPMALPGDDDSKEPDPDHLERWLPPNKAFLDDWLARSSELVTKYHPDFLYFDWWIGQPAFQPYLQRFAAYYYDAAANRHQGVVLTYKGYDFPENAATLDIERGKLDTKRLLPWQTDTSVSIHSWGYANNDEYRSAKSLIDELVDVVSKNGNLLLNVGPKSDGTIPEQARAILLEMGTWLKTNGEAIYGSRPWLVYGEGPTKVAGTAKNSDQQEFTAEDIRFTTHNGALYAIALGWPSSGELRIRSLGRGLPYLKGPVCAVQMLGSDAPISWHQEADGLHIELPTQRPNEVASTFRIMEPEDHVHRCGN